MDSCYKQFSKRKIEKVKLAIHKMWTKNKSNTKINNHLHNSHHQLLILPCHRILLWYQMRLVLSRNYPMKNQQVEQREVSKSCQNLTFRNHNLFRLNKPPSLLWVAPGILSINRSRLLNRTNSLPIISSNFPPWVYFNHRAVVKWDQIIYMARDRLKKILKMKLMKQVNCLVH